MTNPSLGTGLGGPQRPSATVRRQLGSLLERQFPGLSLDEQRRRFLAQLDSARPAGERGTSTLFYRKTVASATRDSQQRRVPLTGILRDVFFHFPAGPSFLVDVRLLLRTGHAERQIVPEEIDTFITLDDSFMPLVDLTVPVVVGSNLIVEWSNTDDTYSHTVPVICVLAATG